MIVGLNSLLLSTVDVWDHILCRAVDWEAGFVFWRAGCRAALQPTQYLPLNIPKCWKVGQNFPAGCILLLPGRSQRWMAGVLLAPSPTLVGLPCCPIYLGPYIPRYDTWLQTAAFLICPTRFYLLFSLPPSCLFCRKLCVLGLLNMQCGGMLNCLL